MFNAVTTKKKLGLVMPHPRVPERRHIIHETMYMLAPFGKRTLDQVEERNSYRLANSSKWNKF